MKHKSIGFAIQNLWRYAKTRTHEKSLRKHSVSLARVRECATIYPCDWTIWNKFPVISNPNLAGLLPGFRRGFLSTTSSTEVRRS